MDRDLDNSRPFDVHRWSDHPEVNRFVDCLWEDHGFKEIVEGIKSSSRGPKPKSDLKKQFKVVLLDLYVCWMEDPEQCIGVHLDNNYYKAGSRYNSLHISKLVISIIHVLHDNNLIGLDLGTEGAGRITRVWAEESLIKLFKSKAKFDPSFVGRDPNQEVIILNANVLGRNDKESVKPIEYDDSDHECIPKWRDDVRQYNSLLASTYVDIGNLEKPWIDRKLWNKKKSREETRRVRIDQQHKFVRRIFYRGSWELGGRFHGGFWQQVKDRSNILINDQKTVEIDYSGLHVSLAYCKEGIEPPQDPYTLPPILSDYTAKEQRAVVKGLVLMAINAKSREDAFRAFRLDQDTGSREKKLTNKVLETVLSAFEAHHPDIVQYLCSDAGVELMKLDGDITARVINHFTEKGTPVLTVHDSYIVPVEYDGELIRQMNKATSVEVGFEVSLSYEHLGYDLTMGLNNLDPLDRLANFERILALGKSDRCEGYLKRWSDWKDRNCV